MSIPFLPPQFPSYVPVTTVTTAPFATVGAPMASLFSQEPDTAADILDAADGVRDGKFFGMKILSPTKADRYMSPTRESLGGVYTSSDSFVRSSLSGGYATTSYTAPPAAMPFASSLGDGPVPSSSVPLPPAPAGEQGSSKSADAPAGDAAPSSSAPPPSFSGGALPPLPSTAGTFGPPNFSSQFPTFGGSTLPPATFGTFGDSSLLGASITNPIFSPAPSSFIPTFDSASYLNMSTATTFPGSTPLFGASPTFSAPLASSILSSSLPPASPFPALYSSSVTATPFVGTLGTINPDVTLSPTKTAEGGSTINISNTGWEKAVEELKKEVEALKADGGMAALRDLLQMKVEELERVRQSELVKEKELHRLQDMYAEEIRKHTEDLARARKAEADLAAARQAEADRIRAQQLEQERAAKEALDQIEALRAAEAARKKPKKKAKKVGKASPRKSPPRVIR